MTYAIQAEGLEKRFGETVALTPPGESDTKRRTGLPAGPPARRPWAEVRDQAARSLPPRLVKIFTGQRIEPGHTSE